MKLDINKHKYKSHNLGKFNEVQYLSNPNEYPILIILTNSSIIIYYVDDFSPNVPVEQNFLGEAYFKLGQVASAYGGLTLDLKGEKGEKVGEVVIQGNERKRGTNSIYLLEFEAQGFPYQYTFYRLSKKLPNEKFAAIYESETSNLNNSGCHVFKTAEIHSVALISDNESQLAQIEFFEWNNKGKHRSLGKKQFTITQMIEMIPINFKGGKFKVLRCEKQERHSFLDYVQGGLEIALTIGVDFTLSNKDPSNPESLHYFDLLRNQYLQAITSVGQILENYDSDKRFSVFGFGARVPFLLDRTSHCFALNGDIFSPEVAGIQGVVEAYKNVLNVVKLNGPTYFAPILSYLNSLVEHEINVCKLKKYYILLIITDGLINDMAATVDEIVRATALPISIIIVGVGNEDFDAMEVLDADEKPLYSEKLKKYMERDIVQFVPFREFKGNPLELAKQTLEEVPGQLLSYMHSKNIPPVRFDPPSAPVLPYFEFHKQGFIQSLQALSYSDEKIMEILSKGLPECSADLFQMHAFNPYFRNPLSELNAHLK